MFLSPRCLCYDVFQPPYEMLAHFVHFLGRLLRMLSSLLHPEEWTGRRTDGRTDKVKPTDSHVFERTVEKRTLRGDSSCRKSEAHIKDIVFRDSKGPALPTPVKVRKCCSDLVTSVSVC